MGDSGGGSKVLASNDRSSCEFEIFKEALQCLKVVEVILLARRERVPLGCLQFGDEPHAQFTSATRRQQRLIGAGAEQYIGGLGQFIFHSLAIDDPNLESVFDISCQKLGTILSKQEIFLAERVRMVPAKCQVGTVPRHHASCGNRVRSKGS